MVLVAIEGMTNSGKSTVSSMLGDLARSRGMQCTRISELARTDVISKMLKAITHPTDLMSQLDPETEAILYAGHLSRKTIAIGRSPFSSDEHITIVDRYTLSILSFFIYVRGLPRQSIVTMVQFASRNIIPDWSLYLDVSLETAISRSVASPLSRKDVGLADYWDELREGALREHAGTARRSRVIVAENRTAEEIADEALNLLLGER